MDPKDFKDHKHFKFGDKSQNSFMNTASNTLSKFDASNMQSRLNTGTEHWKTNYEAVITNPYQSTKARRPEWTYNKPPYTVEK